MTEPTQRDTFLAVDDARESLELIRLILGRYFPGARLICEQNSLKALEIAKKIRPDLILLDVKMPDMDGFEFAKRVRMDPAMASMPILMISGVITDVRGRITGLESGAESFLAKPFEAMELVAQVRALLRIRHSEEALRTHQAELEQELERRTQKLRESERKFRMLFENSPDAVFVEDEKGIVLDANLAACRLHEMTREQIVGAHVSALVPPAQRAQVVRDYAKWFKTGMEQYEGQSWTSGGKSIPVEIRSRKVEYDGRPAVLLQVRDLQERRHAEEERNRLIPAIEQSAEAIFITDAQGAIQYVNGAFEQITGFTRAEAQGRRPNLLHSGRHEATFYRHMWETILHGNVWNGRVINKRKDGRLFHAELTISPVRDPQGTLVNFVAVSRDITHEMELEEQLHQAQKMESIGRLAGGVAHDFNNLLTSIMGFSHLVYNRLPEGSPLLAEVKEIIFSAERAAQLTRQLLAFSRKEVRHVQPLDLNSILHEMEHLLRRTLGEDIELRIATGAQSSVCEGDLMQMQQVVLNLAINARDAMPRGGHLDIQIKNVKLDAAFCETRVGLEPGDYVQLSVRDDGCGIPEEQHSHIFEPFFTTKDKGHGTGLGLSMVYAIVQQARGHIEFISELKHGTEFILYVPRSTATVGVAAATAAPRVRGGKETILVVEDEELVRDTALRLLGTLGYNVLSAGDAREAEALCKRFREPLHLILTDVVMPKVSGSEMIRRLSLLRKDFKVLYMSGFTDDTIMQHGVTRQRVNFLSKPFTRDTLGLKVREVLDSKE